MTKIGYSILRAYYRTAQTWIFTLGLALSFLGFVWLCAYVSAILYHQ